MEVTEFGRSKYNWLATFLALPNGIPSHDTFGRVFARSDPEQFQRSFLAWVQPIQGAPPEVIAIDGKTHRGSHDRQTGQAAMHLVSAWAAENRLVLGQIAVDDTSNEITAIPQLLDLRGGTVTLNAMGTQTAIAERIIQRGGQYVLALKNHQPTLSADVTTLFADARVARQPAYGMQTERAVTKGLGRIETRQAFVIHDPAVVAYLNERQRWAQLSGMALVEAERTRNGVTTIEQRYDLLTRAWDAATVNTLVRGHWGIENQVNWGLDVVFHKDASRIRTGRCAPEHGCAAAHCPQSHAPGAKQGQCQNQTLSDRVG